MREEQEEIEREAYRVEQAIRKRQLLEGEIEKGEYDVMQKENEEKDKENN